MAVENKKILQRINSYAENTFGEIDPQKVPISAQLEKLKPIVAKITEEKSMPLLFR